MSSVTSTVFSIKEGHRLTIRATAESKTAKHPSSWFSSHPNQKPSLVILKTPATVELTKGIYNSLLTGKKIHLDLALDFLHRVYSTKKAKLEDKWSSYGVTIGEAGSEVNPFSLLEVEIKTGVTQDIDLGQISPQESDEMWMAVWILAFYRLDRITDSQYRTETIKRIQQTLINLGCPNAAGVSNSFIAHRTYANSKSFRKIVAAIDMFYFKFDTIEGAESRISTTGSRFRDCAALQSFAFINGVLGFKAPGDLLYWVFNEVLAKEVIQMFKIEEEDHLADSYFPYHIDFDLVDRSPYSSRMNPGLHFFTNIIGAMMANKRCINARFNLEKDIKNILSNAQWVGYVFMNKTERELHFVSEDPAITRQATEQAARRAAEARGSAGASGSSTVPVESAITSITTPPNNRDAASWFAYINSRDGEPDDDMKECLRKTQAQITTFRPGTIGEFVKSTVFI